MKVVLGSLVIQCPQVTFAKDAYDQCRLACELFAKVKGGFGAEKVYVSNFTTICYSRANVRSTGQDGCATGPSSSVSIRLSFQ
jgi:hypothetical protein